MQGGRDYRKFEDQNLESDKYIVTLAEFGVNGLQNQYFCYEVHCYFLSNKLAS